jgi:transcriptional regulator with XRE-family HTH domain
MAREISKEDQLWGARLKQARLAAGLSQKSLGIETGIDEFAASARINRYELGVHRPDLLTVKNLAKTLKVPAAFFYADDDDIADLIYGYSKTRVSVRNSIKKLLNDIQVPPTQKPRKQAGATVKRS